MITMRRIGILFLLVACLGLILSGCGSNRSASLGTYSTVTRSGLMHFTVAWPPDTPTRLIPQAARSIEIKVRRIGGSTQRTVLVKPAGPIDPGTTTSYTFSNLETGGGTVTQVTYAITATAFPNTDATGVPMALKADQQVSLTPEVPEANIQMVMGTTIRSLEITPSNPAALRNGEALTMTATAHDADNRVVLTTPGQITWNVSETAYARFPSGATTTGNPVVLTAQTVNGQDRFVTVTATEGESNIAAIAVSVTITPSGIANSNWPRFRGSITNRGNAPATTPALTQTPAIRFNASASPNVVLSSPALGRGNRVYIGAFDSTESDANANYLYSFDTASGTQVWRTALNGGIEAGPVCSELGPIYIGTLSGRFYRVNEDGSIGWTATLNGAIHQAANMDKKGYLYVTTSGGTIYKLDSFTGRGIWQQPFSSAIQNSPALSSDESRVYCATEDGRILSLDTSTGAILATRTIANATFHNSSIVVGKIGGVETLFLASLEGNVQAYAATDLRSLWSKDTFLGNAIYATPALSPDDVTLYVATFDLVNGLHNKVVALNATTGTTRWQTADLSAGMTSSPALSGDGSVLYAATYDGTIYGIGTDTGASKWTFQPDPGQSFDSSPALGADGTLYIGGFSGRLYALK